MVVRFVLAEKVRCIMCFCSIRDLLPKSRGNRYYPAGIIQPIYIPADQLNIM